MTYLNLFDLNSGSNSSDPKFLTKVGDIFFFVADDGNSGKELWKFDPKVDSSPQLFDLNSGKNSSEPTYFNNINEVLFFSADIPSNGRELWKFDPGVDNTPQLFDLNPGSDGSYPFFFTDVDGVTYGIGDISTNQKDLWKFDSTTDIEPQLLDINSVNNSLSQSYFTNSRGIFYFVVNNGTKDTQLWKFDPKVDPSPQLFDWNLSENLTIARVDWIDDKFYLMASESNIYEIWQFDPNTDFKPQPISSFNTDSSNLSYFSLVSHIEDTIFWTSYALNNFDGYHLWKFNPKTDNTVQLVDSNSSNPYQLIESDRRLYFNTDDAHYGQELAVFDPLEEKVEVFDLNVGSKSSYVQNLIEIDRTLFFTANNGINGNELWKFDPKVDSQPQLFDLNVGSEDSNPYSLVEVDGVLYFATKIYNQEDGGYRSEIWRSDSTEIGTYALGEIKNNVDFKRGLVEIDHTIYFVAEDSDSGIELFSLDTTPALGRVRVVVETEGVSQTDFNFDGDWGSFTLDRNHQQTSFTDQLPGVYTLDLDLPSGWMIDSVIITGENQQNSYSNISQVVLGLDTREDLTVTYRLMPVIKGNGEANLLNGSVAAEYIWGNGGNDTLRGRDGGDRLYGGVDHDWLSGGSGDDSLFGQKHDDTLQGNIGSDRLFGGSGNDLLLGGVDDDTLIGNLGDDTLKGGSGGDRLNGSGGDDILYGNRGDDRLWGKGGNDTLKGGSGNDLIVGGSGNDTLYGHDGRDTLKGGVGEDRLFGGLDADVFVIDRHQTDWIMDYQAGVDRIKLDRLSYDELSITTFKNRTLIEAFDRPIAIVKGVVDLDESDFIVE